MIRIKQTARKRERDGLDEADQSLKRQQVKQFMESYPYGIPMRLPQSLNSKAVEFQKNLQMMERRLVEPELTPSQRERATKVKKIAQSQLDDIKTQQAQRRSDAYRFLTSKKDREGNPREYLSRDLAQKVIRGSFMPAEVKLDTVGYLSGSGMVYGGGHESYGETLAGGSFGSWFKDHLGAIGAAALIGAQFIPGVDAVVDAGVGADVAATGAEAAEGAEGAEGADAAEGASKASKASKAPKRYKNPIRRGVKKVGTYGGLGAQGVGAVIGSSGGQPPPPPPPGGGPPPNVVGEYSSASGNPYLN